MFHSHLTSSSAMPSNSRPGMERSERANEDSPSVTHDNSANRSYATSGDISTRIRSNSSKSIGNAPIRESNVKCEKPLYHLKGREVIRYEQVTPLHNMSIFDVALELFNRRSVLVVVKKIWERVAQPEDHVESSGALVETHSESSQLCRYFYECKGKMKASLKVCTSCRDVEKERVAFDWYYIDLVEISQQRRVRCRKCMYALLKRNVHGSNEHLLEELKELRDEQSCGVSVDPFTMWRLINQTVQ